MMAVKGVHGYQGYNGFKDATHKPSKNYSNLAGEKEKTQGSKMKEMIDNRKVGANKGGIAAKVQRGKVEKTWQDGAMHQKSGGGSFKRGGESLTPRKA